MKTFVRVRRETLQLFLLGLIIIGQIVVIFAFFVPFFVGEMIISFLPYALVLSVTGLLLARNRTTPFLPLVFSILWVFCFGIYLLNISLPIHIDNKNDTHSKKSIRVASYNKLVLTDLSEDTLTQLSPKNYDVLAVVELEPHNYRKIARNWNYSVRTDCACDPASQVKTSELAIFSSFPLSRKTTDQDIVKRGKSQLPTELDFHGTNVDLLAVHPDAPYTRSKNQKQNSQLRQLHNQFIKIKKPTIVMGDFNVTAYSPRYRKLLHGIDLHDAGINQGHKITWCFNEAKMFCAPIDHILSNGFVLKNYSVKRLGKSDHRLVEADLVLK